MGRQRKRRNGEGSVMYRKDRGAWYGVYTDAKDGKRKWRKLDGAKGEKQAREMLAEVIAKTAKPKVDGDLYPLRDAYLAYLSSYASEKGVKSIASKLKAILTNGGFAKLENVTPEAIDLYKQNRVKMPRRNPNEEAQMRGTVSKRTVNHEISSLKMMLSWAEDTGRIPVNPIVRAKGFRLRKADKTLIRRALSADEVTRLIDPVNSPRGLDLIWDTFLGTGLRRDELSQMEWTDLDLDDEQAWLTVRAEVSKNGDEDTIPIPRRLAERLRAHKAKGIGEGLVFINTQGGSIYGKLVDRLYRCLRRAEINPAGVDVHALRKTFVTELVRQGLDAKKVQTLARHKTIAMTMEVYAELNPVELVGGVESLSWADEGGEIVSQDVSQGGDDESEAVAG